MGRYFLHLRNVSGDILIDRQGLELPDLQAAREEAVDAARGILADVIKAGSDLDAEAILVTDDQGEELDRVHLTEVLPKGLLRLLCESFQQGLS
jgi:hypothetical protein